MNPSDYQLPKEDLDLVLEHCRAELGQLHHKSLLLTGGTGFVGKCLLESLLSAADVLDVQPAIFVVTRHQSRFLQQHPWAEHPLLTIIESDVANFTAPAGSLDYIIHAATDSSASAHPGKLLSHSIEATRHVLDIAVRAATTRVLFTSSGAVYGKDAGDLEEFTETSASRLSTTTRQSAYGEGKRVSELLGSIAAEDAGFDFLIARLFAFVGPHLPIDQHFAVGNFIHDALYNDRITVSGDGTALRSYMYSADLVIWLLKILFNGNSGSPYNVGSPDAISIKALAQTIGRISGKAVHISQSPKPDITPERYLPSVLKATRELGLDIHFSLEDAIERTIRWHQRADSNS